MLSGEGQTFLGKVGDGFALFAGRGAEVAHGFWGEAQEHGLAAGGLAAGALAGTAPNDIV